MKRHLLIIAICLLLGAVLNVAVVWGCALLLSADEVGTRETWTGDVPTPRDPGLLDRWLVVRECVLTEGVSSSRRSRHLHSSP